MQSPNGDQVLQKELGDFTVVEIKSGTSQLTSRERQIQESCASKNIRYTLYRISKIDKNPASWDLVNEI